MVTAVYIKKELQPYTDAEQAKILTKFFQVRKGGYGEGDKFIGINVPNMRKVAKQYCLECSLPEIEKLLQDEVHEYRITAVFMLTYLFEKKKSPVPKKDIIDLYIKNIAYVNNWDLVDLSAYKLLGTYLLDKDRSLLYEYAKSNDLWKQRVSMIATFAFIRNQEFDDTLKLAEMLLLHEHDLMHKAVGWMLREIGKRDYAVEFDFLKKHYKSMPRTMLRYAIEKFEENTRQQFLKGCI